jgi:hypothetical protein
MLLEFSDFEESSKLRDMAMNRFFQCFCINLFGMGPLQYHSSRSNFGFEYVEIIVWTPFNKLGRIYGKKINESAKKSPVFSLENPGVWAW